MSQAGNRVKYWALCMLTDSAERRLICDSRTFWSQSLANDWMDVCAWLCMHTSVNFAAVLMRSRTARSGVCVCKCVCVSMSSHLRCQIIALERGSRKVNIYSEQGKFLFMKTNTAGNNAGQKRRIKDGPRDSLAAIKTCWFPPLFNHPCHLWSCLICFSFVHNETQIVLQASIL